MIRAILAFADRWVKSQRPTFDPARNGRKSRDWYSALVRTHILYFDRTIGLGLV